MKFIVPDWSLSKVKDYTWQQMVHSDDCVTALFIYIDCF